MMAWFLSAVLVALGHVVPTWPTWQDGGADEGASGSASPYAVWPLGPPTDPAWFPIGVWLQEPHLAERYAELGVNTFVGLWEGPTEEQLATLSEAGMRVICAANTVGIRHRKDPTIIAWMQMDEPDNHARFGRGPQATPAEIQERYADLKRRDPRRPVWLNLGQGVANDEWVGRGARRSDYPAYVAGTDIVSFDVYPVTNIRRSDGEDYLWYVAKGVERLRMWGKDEKLVWNLIECTRTTHATKKPTPEQVRAEVWLGLVAGSRGLVYFCHEFEPKVGAAALLADAPMCAAVRRINAEVLRYAPVLNAPTLRRKVRVESSKDDVPVGVLLKEHDGTRWLFAIGQRNERVEATFALTDDVAGGATEVRVQGEERKLELENGRFRDAFAPYELHVYRW